MAQTITAGTGNRLEVTSAPVTAYPFTMACWFNVPDVTSNFRLMQLTGGGSAAELCCINARGDVVGDPVNVQINNGTVMSQENTSSTAGFTAGAWYAATAVLTSSTSRTIYLNGGNSATGTGTYLVPAVDWFGMQVIRLTSTYYASGASPTIAEPAIWDVALNAGEVAAYAKGFSPLLIRPSGLVAYWPLGGAMGNNYRDHVGTFSLSATGTVTKTDHPAKIIYPSRQLIVPAYASVATPWLYRSRQSQIIGGGVL